MTTPIAITNSMTSSVPLLIAMRGSSKSAHGATIDSDASDILYYPSQKVVIDPLPSSKLRRDRPVGKVRVC